MLHSAIYWLKGGKVGDLLKRIANYISKFLCDADVYLVFSRYVEYSIKSDTRLERLGQLQIALSWVTSSIERHGIEGDEDQGPVDLPHRRFSAQPLHWFG